MIDLGCLFNPQNPTFLLVGYRNVFDAKRGPIECSQLEQLHPIRLRIVQVYLLIEPMTFRHDVILDRYCDGWRVLVQLGQYSCAGR